MKPTAEQVWRCFDYDAETGQFTWRIQKAQRVSAGDRTGFLRPDGYISLAIDGSRHYAHRIAWLYMTGEWPAGMIDHINGNRSDNRFANLRTVDRAANMQNQKRAHSCSQSGLLGASPIGEKWRATIRSSGRAKYLGSFGTPEEAHAAYMTAKRQLHAGCTI